jgi:uncharacterized protein YjbI with pentapeptide repeats
MEVWLILLVLIFFGILVLLLVLYDRGYMQRLPLQWTGMGYAQVAKETQEAQETKQTITYNMQPRKTLWDLLQLFLVPLVLAIVVFAFNAGQASTSQQLADQSQQKQVELADQSQQEQVVNTYIDQMSNLVLQYHLHDSQLADPIRAVAQALTLTALSRLDSAHKNIIILFLYRADLLKYHFYKHNETDCGDPKVLKKQFSDENPIITLSQGNIAGVTINNLKLSCIDLLNMHLEGSNFSTSLLDRANFGLSLAMNADFSYASMKSADLFYLDLSGANLQGALLQYADMKGICLSHARLDGADLQGADLRVYTHSVNYATLFCGQHDYATLTPANLSDADLTHANLTGAYLNGANLKGADLTHANLNGADLSGANLSGANLDKTTVLKGARYNSKEILVKDSQGNNLMEVLPTIWPQGFNPKAARATENNTLSGANLSGASLPGANLSDTPLHGANLSGADLRGADLSLANLIKANFSGASLNKASLWGADLSGANLSGAKITQAQLNEAESLKNAIMPDGKKHT